MTATQLSPLSPSCLTEVTGHELQRSVQLVLWNTPGMRLHSERRREKRYPYPYPIWLTPVDGDLLTPTGDAFAVLGKHLSLGGLDFYHGEPIPDRWVIATFDCNGERSVSLLMELTWCRFRRFGWYENGGRFTESLPFEPPGVCPEFTEN